MRDGCFQSVGYKIGAFNGTKRGLSQNILRQTFLHTGKLRLLIRIVGERGADSRDRTKAKAKGGENQNNTEQS